MILHKRKQRARRLHVESGYPVPQCEKVLALSNDSYDNTRMVLHLARVYDLDPTHLVNLLRLESGLPKGAPGRNDLSE